MNLASSPKYGDNVTSGEDNILGNWIFKTYTITDKIIILEGIVFETTCTATACLGIGLTSLKYQESKLLNSRSGFQDTKTAKVVMSDDQRHLSIMVCDDFSNIKSPEKCSFITGIRVGFNE